MGGAGRGSGAFASTRGTRPGASECSNIEPAFSKPRVAPFPLEREAAAERTRRLRPELAGEGAVDGADPDD